MPTLAVIEFEIRRFDGTLVEPVLGSVAFWMHEQIRERVSVLPTLQISKPHFGSSWRMDITEEIEALQPIAPNEKALAYAVYTLASEWALHPLPDASMYQEKPMYEGFIKIVAKNLTI